MSVRVPVAVSRGGLKLTCWVRGTNPSTLVRERARASQIGERNTSEAEQGEDLARFLVAVSVRVRVPVPRRSLGAAAVLALFRVFPWRKASPPNHLDDKVDADQQVVNTNFSLSE